MSPNLFRLILLIAVPFLALASAQATDEFTPCKPGAKIFYINGVNKPNEQMVAFAAKKLEKNIAHFSVTCVAEVSYLFNPSDGLILDVLEEFAKQKATELSISFGEAFLQVGLSAFGQISSLSQESQQQLLDRIIALVQNYSLSNSFTTIDGATFTTADLVSQFRDRVLTELKQGTKTILVAHSQGNLFANETYNAVLAGTGSEISKGMAVVNVANAASTAPSGLWITAIQDLVIQPLALAGLATGSNFDATGAYTFDLTGHGFDEVYMNRGIPTKTAEASSIAAQVMALLRQALNTAQTPVSAILGSTSYALFEMNPSSSVAATILGYFSFANSSSAPIWDIAVNPRTGAIYAISPSAVYVLDKATLRLTRLPQSTVGGNALAFSADGQMYGMSGATIYRFDTQTGTATVLPVSLGSYVSSGDLTFDSDGNLFGTAVGPGGVDYLVRIDLNRSTVSIIGSTGYSSVYGLLFSGGYLYGMTAGGTLINIDRATGSAHFAQQLPFDGITGLQ